MSKLASAGARTLVVTAASLSLIACSAAQRPAGAPAREAPLTTLEEAEAELSRAEARLPATVTAPSTGDGAAPGRHMLTEEKKPAEAPKDKASAAPPPPPVAPAGAAAPSKAARDGDRDDRERAADEGDVAPTPCQTACRALASMRRAADAVCRIAGDTDARCDGARKRVDAATTRVAHCGCKP